jgi:hypothetical protein
MAQKQLQDKEMSRCIDYEKSSLPLCHVSVKLHQQFRQTIQQIRILDEQFQYQLFQMAEQKGFYKPAPQANQSDIQAIKSQVSSS